jgi:hypothetical protein
MERVTGIGPASPAWKAGALPLSYTRMCRSTGVGEGGFEPPASCPQSRCSNQAELLPVSAQGYGRSASSPPHERKP